jgi:hypothetical protein
MRSQATLLCMFDDRRTSCLSSRLFRRFTTNSFTVHKATLLSGSCQSIPEIPANFAFRLLALLPPLSTTKNLQEKQFIDAFCSISLLLIVAFLPKYFN